MQIFSVMIPLHRKSIVSLYKRAFLVCLFGGVGRGGELSSYNMDLTFMLPRAAMAIKLQVFALLWLEELEAN